jgi:hypothetical protein
MLSLASDESSFVTGITLAADDGVPIWAHAAWLVVTGRRAPGTVAIGAVALLTYCRD